MRHLSFFYALLFAFLGLSGCFFNSSTPAGGTEHPVDFRTNGIRFKIAATVKADPIFSYAMHDYDDAEAALSVQIRISAHAQESQFFGEVAEIFSNFQVKEGSAEKLFWQDARCHQRRGLPKTTVTAIDGFITAKNAQVSIQARPRQLGLPLPLDEITQGVRLFRDFSQQNAFIAYRSRSKLSHLLVDVKIYQSNCALGGE
jgi:hypothetical protein